MKKIEAELIRACVVPILKGDHDLLWRAGVAMGDSEDEGFRVIGLAVRNLLRLVVSTDEGVRYPSEPELFPVPYEQVL